MLDIKRTVRTHEPRLPFQELKNAALGGSYELSLVICSDKLARRVNTEYRGKTYAANVLSFPLSKTEGEMFLNARAAKREARAYGVSERSRLALLVVHGLFHLKGYRHGRTMEDEERNLLRRFGLSR